MKTVIKSPISFLFSRLNYHTSFSLSSTSVVSQTSSCSRFRFLQNELAFCKLILKTSEGGSLFFCMNHRHSYMWQYQNTDSILLECKLCSVLSSCCLEVCMQTSKLMKHVARAGQKCSNNSFIGKHQTAKLKKMCLIHLRILQIFVESKARFPRNPVCIPGGYRRAVFKPNILLDLVKAVDMPSTLPDLMNGTMKPLHTVRRTTDNGGIASGTWQARANQKSGWISP